MNLSVESVASYWDELEKVAKLPRHLKNIARGEPKVKTAMAVQDMQRGDIIVASPGPTHERASAGHKFQDWLFTKASPYWQGLFTHAGIYVGDGKTIEAYPKGIIQRPVGKLLKNRSYVVVRPKVTKAKRETAARFAESQLGKPYSKADLIRASLRTMLPASAATLVGGAPGIPDKKNSKGYQCGGLVAASYAAAEAPLNPKTNPRYTPPNELILGDSSQVVGRVMRKGHTMNAPMGRAMRAPWIKKMEEFNLLRKDHRAKRRMEKNAGYWEDLTGEGVRRAEGQGPKAMETFKRLEARSDKLHKRLKDASLAGMERGKYKQEKVRTFGQYEADDVVRVPKGMKDLDKMSPQERSAWDATNDKKKPAPGTYRQEPRALKRINKELTEAYDASRGAREAVSKALKRRFNARAGTAGVALGAVGLGTGGYALHRKSRR